MARRKRIQYKGNSMASKSEVMFATACDSLKIPWKYETEAFYWDPLPAKPKRYTPDFVIPKKDGGKIYIEYKGYLRTPDKRKMIAMKQQHPELDIRFVFESAKKPMTGAAIRKDGTRLTHGEWADKYGFPWCQWNPRGKFELAACFPQEWRLEIA